MPQIAKADWKWFGHAGHLIVARHCQFHLCTQIGPWLVSTVGEYVPDETSRQIHADFRGVTLKGKGDERYADFMNKCGFIEIGAGRKYETMVFRAGEPCTEPGCMCGLPTPTEWSELDTQGYNDAVSATRGHYAMCERWSDVQPPEKTASEAEAATQA